MGLPALFILEAKCVQRERYRSRNFYVNNFRRDIYSRTSDNHVNRCNFDSGNDCNFPPRCWKRNRNDPFDKLSRSRYHHSGKAETENSKSAAAEKGGGSSACNNYFEHAARNRKPDLCRRDSKSVERRLARPGILERPVALYRFFFRAAVLGIFAKSGRYMSSFGATTSSLPFTFAENSTGASSMTQSGHCSFPSPITSTAAVARESAISVCVYFSFLPKMSALPR